MKHELKVWPEPFQALWNGTKKFEYRKNDRDFKVGDCLWLKEWSPESKDYLGDSITFWVSYIVKSPDWGIPEGYCIMSLCDFEEECHPPPLPSLPVNMKE